MKSDIHPAYHKTKVKCACGATFEFGSTAEAYSVDVCAKCHPFYTGKHKLVDTAGRVDKFKERMKVAEKHKADDAERMIFRKKKESVEDKIVRKVEAKEAVKVAEKQAKEEAKKKIAKKQAEKVTVKPAKTEKAEKKSVKKVSVKKK